MMKPLCIYHKIDLDGVCSAAIVKHFDPECELVGFDYGLEFPWDRVPFVGNKAQGDGWHPVEPRRRVYVVDISLPVEDMKRLAEVSDLVWIDHHKTAIDACHAAGVNPAGLRNIGFAACELAWLWFSNQEQHNRLNAGGYYPAEYGRCFDVPEAVRLLGAYDSWRSQDPEWDSKVLPFQYGMRSVPGIYDPSDGNWGALFEFKGMIAREEMPSMLDVGDAVLRYQTEANLRACEAGARVVYVFPPGVDKLAGLSACKTGFTALCCNTAVFNSQFFKGFYDPEKHDIMLAYCQLATKKWKVSIYTTKDGIDCGAIATAFGGGGHRKAAGFLCDRLPWGEQ